MGGWREQLADQQQRQQQRNLMPARYSGQREQLEAEVKLFHVTVLSAFATKAAEHSWEALRQ
eukprot:5403380-Amphidinium_carterae.1